MINNLTIIICSSDGYKDCWVPFIVLLNKYFPNSTNYEILFVSNEEKLITENTAIKSITTNTPEGHVRPWSERLQIALDNATNDLVLFLLEDYFLRTPVDEERLKHLVALMVNDNNIAHIRLKTGSWKIEKSKYDDLDLIGSKSKYRLSLQPGIWRKHVLQKYIVPSESAWELEVLGSIRANFAKDKFYSVTQKSIDEKGYIYECAKTGGIIKGQWVEDEVVHLFKENNIIVDLSIRGFYSNGDETKNKKKLRKAILHNYRNLFKTITFVIKSIFLEK